MLPRIDRVKLSNRALDSVKSPSDVGDIQKIFWGITSESGFLKKSMPEPKSAELIDWKVYAIHKLCVFLLLESGKIPNHINRILARFDLNTQAELISTSREIIKSIDLELWGFIHQKKGRSWNHC